MCIDESVCGVQLVLASFFKSLTHASDQRGEESEEGFSRQWHPSSISVERSYFCSDTLVLFLSVQSLILLRALEGDSADPASLFFFLQSSLRWRLMRWKVDASEWIM